VGKTIARVLDKTFPETHGTKSPIQAKMERTKMGLIITHIGYILNYVPADQGHVLFDGKLSCTGNPRELLNCVTERGYEECVKCSIVSN
jgi:Fe-S cluster assembly ATP-binding protein